MPLAGTLHEEALQKGMGRLLSVQIVASPVASVVFTLPGPQTRFDTYLFDIIRLRPSAATAFLLRQSMDGGASWDATPNYWWSQLYSFSHAGPPRGGHTGAGTLGGDYLKFYYMIGDAQPTVDSNVELFIHSVGSPIPMAKAHSYGWESFGSIQRITAGHLSGAINAVQFYFYPSANINAGEFRMYGIKKGVA